MTKCPKQYKNVGMEAFGNKKKVTEEMLTQFCKNDSYLYAKYRELENLTDPESRKRYVPPFKDDAKSVNVEYNEDDKYYYISNSNSTELKIYFKDDEEEGYDIEDYIDLDKSTLGIDTTNGKVHIPLTDYDTTLEWEDVKKESSTTKSKKTVYGKAVQDSYYEGPYGKYAPNGTWYCGYNYTKTYSVKSAWKKNPYNPSYKIPSLSRCQTFTALKTGVISSVTINVKADKKTAYPLRMEIRSTDKKGYPTSKILGSTTKKFTHTNLALEAFQFKKSIPVTKGETYAIVMRCPLAPYSASYHVAGWQQGCYTKKTKQALATARKTKGVGYSFESTDNCNTWKKYNAGDGAGYKDSNKNPSAFGYEVKISPSSTTIVEETTEKYTKEKATDVETIQARAVGVEYHLYFKPIRCEEIKKLISKIDSIDNYSNAYAEITHHISPDGKNWYTAQHSNTGVVFNFDAPYKDYLLYRITMKVIKRDENWSPQKEGECDFEGYYDSSNKIFYHDYDSTTSKFLNPFTDSEKIENCYYLDKKVTPNKSYEYVGGSNPYQENNPKPQVNPQKIDDTLRDNPLLSGKLLLDITHSIPTKAYLRTTEYIPLSYEMLPSCIWSEFDTEYEENGNSSVEVDIVRGIEHKQPLKVVTPTLKDLRGYELTYSQNKARYARNIDLDDYLDEYKQQCTSSEELPTTDAKVNEFIQKNRGGDNDILDWLLEKHDIFVSGLYDYDSTDKILYGTNDTIKLDEYLAYPTISCDLKNDSLYLIADNGDFGSYNYKSKNDTDTNGVDTLYSTRIHNFEGQIDKVELYSVENDNVVYEFQKSVSTDELKDYLKSVSVRGYLKNSTTPWKFYEDSAQTKELDAVDGKYYCDISSDSTDDTNWKYYKCTVTGTTPSYTEKVYSSENIKKEWGISEADNRLEIYYTSADSTDTSIGLNDSTIQNYFKITKNSDDKITKIELNNRYAIKVTFKDTNMIEGIDYEIDYDNATIRFYNSEEDGTAKEDGKVFLWSYDTFQTGNLDIVYNPLWVRGLKEEDVPIRMDLFEDNYRVILDGSTKKSQKITFDNNGDVVVLSESDVETYNDNECYVFDLSVSAVDNLRSCVIEREDDEDDVTELIEDYDFEVDYHDNKVYAKTSLFNYDEIIDIKYTPDIREFGLSVGYRLSRTSTTDDDNVKIKSFYFTTRT